MKRVLLVVTAATVLVASAAPAAASTGPARVAGAGAAAKGGQLGFFLAFQVNLEGGEPVSVSRFRFRNMRVNCDQGRVLLRARLGRMDVVDDKFDETLDADEGDGTIRAKGTLRRNGRRGVGKLFVDSLDVALDGGGTATNCNGEKRWETRAA